jgi:hypothetical protein
MEQEVFVRWGIARWDASTTEVEKMVLKGAWGGGGAGVEIHISTSLMDTSSYARARASQLLVFLSFKRYNISSRFKHNNLFFCRKMTCKHLSR